MKQLRTKIGRVLGSLDSAIESRLHSVLPKSLTTRYIVGLGILAALATLTQVLEQITFAAQFDCFGKIRQIDLQISDSRRFGRLIQRIRMDTADHTKASDADEARRFFDSLEESHGKIAAFGNMADSLFGGATAPQIYVATNSTITLLKESFEELYSQTVRHRRSPPTVEIRRLADEVIAQEYAYRSSLEQLNYSLENMMNARIGNARALGLASLALVLLVLLAEALYVFRPAVKQLYEALEARTKFLSKIGHEIRNPMNSILGMTRLVQDTRLTEQQKRYVNVIASSSYSLMGLLNNLIDYSKIRSGRVTPKPQEFDLLRAVQDAADQITYKADEKRLDFVLDFSLDCPERVVCDPLLLRQLLGNLLGNAVKFTNKGEIVLSVWCDVFDGIHRLHCSVADTGIGIQQEKLSEIFEYFQQEDASILRKYGGNGLGLGICLDLVSLAGGKIQAQSQKGVGSRFSFWIPLGLSSSTTLRDQFERKKLSNKRAFVAVAHQGQSEKIEAYLQAYGGGIVSTRSLGERAKDKGFWLDYFESEEFDTYLIDIESCASLIDVLQSAQSRSRRNVLSRVIVLLRSTFPSAALVELNSVGIRSFVYLPVKPLELLGAVNLVVAQRRLPQLADTGEPSAPELSRPLSVLVVDDSRDNQLLMRGYLEKYASLLVFADDGFEAVEKFRQNSFDIVFMDVLMPVMDGCEAVKAMRVWEKEQRRAATPIVAVTAHTSEEERIKCREAGFSAHFAKPLDLVELQKFLARSFGVKKENRMSDASDMEKAWQEKLKAYLPTYYQQRREDLANLRKAMEAGDWAKVVNIGHKIKGSAATYGFPELGEVGAEIEKEAGKKNAGKVRTGIDYIENWLRQVSP